jgi:urease gamma subunit
VRKIIRTRSSAAECLFLYAKVVRAERRCRMLQLKLNEAVAILPKDEMAEYVDGSQKLEQESEARDVA